MNRPCCAICILTLAILTPASASAHALGAECKVGKDGRVHVEAYFEDDTPAQQAMVRIVDAQDQDVVKGQTDAQGRWAFDAPRPGDYQVIIDAGAGHRVVQKLTIPQRGGAADTPSGQVNGAPTREQFTGFPWLKVALGVGTIAALAAAFVLSQRLNPRQRSQ